MGLFRDRGDRPALLGPVRRHDRRKDRRDEHGDRRDDGVTGATTVATGVPAPGCCGDSFMPARTSDPTAVSPLSRAMRVHGRVAS
jgi:hypothetical protein